MLTDKQAKERFKKIIEALDYLYANKAEWDAYERYLDAERSFKSQMDTAKKEGFEQGKLEAEMKKALQIAERLLGRLDVNKIVELTGLTIEQIEELKNNKK
jgi:DnaJ-class molecular chaperone